MPPIPIFRCSLLYDLRVNAIGPREPADEPLCGKVFGLLDALDDVLVQTCVPDRTIITLDVGVLLRLTRLDVG